MLRIQNSNKQLISIGQYQILDTLKTNHEKDIYYVKDLKKPFKKYILKILKANQNAKQINDELEVLNILNKYSQIQKFHGIQIFSDKLLFLFDYIEGKNLQQILQENKNFFDQEKVMLFVDNILTILNIYRKHNILHNNIKMENIIFNNKQFYLIGLSKSQVIDNNKNKYNNQYDIELFSSILVTIINNTHNIDIKKVENLISSYSFNKV